MEDYIKPDLNDYLEHVGKLGMHWGLRRQLRRNDGIRKKAMRTWIPFVNKDAKNLKRAISTHPQLFSKASINDILKSSGKKSILEINKKDLQKGKQFANSMMADTWNVYGNQPSTRYDKRLTD